MAAAHKFLDQSHLKQLTGAELLLLRLRYGRSVAAPVEAELNRRAGAAHGPLEYVPLAAVTTPAGRRRARRSHAA